MNIEAHIETLLTIKRFKRISKSVKTIEDSFGRLKTPEEKLKYLKIINEKFDDIEKFVRCMQTYKK